jgi:hypothetical protein
LLDKDDVLELLVLAALLGLVGRKELIALMPVLSALT